MIRISECIHLRILHSTISITQIQRVIHVELSSFRVGNRYYLLSLTGIESTDLVVLALVLDQCLIDISVTEISLGSHTLWESFEECLELFVIENT